MRGITTTGAALGVALLAATVTASPALAAARPKPVTCTVSYSRPTGPVSNRSSTPGKPNTEEEVACTQSLTGKIKFTVKGKLKVTLSEQADCYPNFTGSWSYFPAEPVASLKNTYVIPAGKTCAAWVFAEVDGHVPFNRMPAITVTGKQ